MWYENSLGGMRGGYGTGTVILKRMPDRCADGKTAMLPDRFIGAIPYDRVLPSMRMVCPAGFLPGLTGPHPELR